MAVAPSGRPPSRAIELTRPCNVDPVWLPSRSGLDTSKMSKLPALVSNVMCHVQLPSVVDCTSTLTSPMPDRRSNSASTVAPLASQSAVLM